MGEHIWLVRNPEGRVIGASVTPAGAVRDVKSHCGATTGAAMTELSQVVYADRNAGSYKWAGYTLTREPLPTGTAGVTRYDGEPQANGSLCCATLTVHGRDYICGEKADHHGEHISPVSHMKWCDNRRPTTPTRGSDVR